MKPLGQPITCENAHTPTTLVMVFHFSLIQNDWQILDPVRCQKASTEMYMTLSRTETLEFGVYVHVCECILSEIGKLE